MGFTNPVLPDMRLVSLAAGDWIIRILYRVWITGITINEESQFVECIRNFETIEIIRDTFAHL
jgi:hypothetical protein